jgi:ribosomal protein L11 methyltransferase
VSESWLQVSVHTGAANIDAISNFLVERGSPGVVLKKRGLDAFFVHSRRDASLRKDIQNSVDRIVRLSSRGGKPRLRWKVIQEKDWQNSWKRFIKPRRVGKAFWITPPWLTAPKFRHRQVITIEPGMAFGTGTHATTRGCIEFLERVADSLGQRNFSALDVGTGSGILAIALVKLGAKAVWAIDNDPVAIEVARKNLRVNGATKEIHLSSRKLSGIRKAFQVVAANLTAETIQELGDGLEQKVGPKGFLILSGIVQRKGDAVIHRFAPKFRVIESKRRNEWLTLLLQRK